MSDQTPAVPTPAADDQQLAPARQLYTVVRRSLLLALVAGGMLLALGTAMVVRLWPSWADPLSAAGTVLGVYLPGAAILYAKLIRPWDGPRR
ncbi:MULTISPECIES: hypothetical protein [Streptomyces]|uniref:Integral membrane protein n=1 Tax=Streptomyces canarius TaxID=285453 RepID=A0ABQ3DD09_9ACTN|nr:hypothetical protein [Streptomyces canarius]GHA76560.1 hypothetical protein GCM10010345_93160 [Streptomyces canarius]